MRFVGGWLQSLLEGKSGDIPTRICDVCDVARAHIKAMEDPSVTGRVIVSTRDLVPTADILAVFKTRFPQYKLQEGTDGDRHQILDNSKVCRMTLTDLPIHHPHLSLLRKVHYA